MRQVKTPARNIKLTHEESQCGGSSTCPKTCKMILQREWNVCWQQIKPGERGREKREEGGIWITCSGTGEETAQRIIMWSALAVVLWSVWTQPYLSPQHDAVHVSASQGGNKQAKENQQIHIAIVFHTYQTGWLLFSRD